MKNKTQKRNNKQTTGQTLTIKRTLNSKNIEYYSEKIKTDLSIPKIKVTDYKSTFYEHTYLQLSDK